MINLNFSSCFPSPQSSDAAAGAGTQTGDAHASPVAPGRAPHRSTPESGPRHHKNCRHLTQPRIDMSTSAHRLGAALHLAVKENHARGIHDFAGALEKIAPDQRLAWLRNLGGDHAMRQSVRCGPAPVIVAWTVVVKLLPDAARLAFLGEKLNDGQADRSPIAANIFHNTESDAIKAWGELLALAFNKNSERSSLLFAGMDGASGNQTLAILLERGEIQALDQFVDLASQHVQSGGPEMYSVLRDCLPTLKILTAQRGDVCEGEAPDWIGREELEFTKPHALSLNSQAIMQAYARLVRLVPGPYRTAIYFQKEIWVNFPRESGDADRLQHGQARDLAHSMTLLKAMVPAMSEWERATVLDEIRSRHASKTMRFWRNTVPYEQFKKTWPALDAMLLDLKAELKP